MRIRRPGSGEPRRTRVVWHSVLPFQAPETRVAPRATWKGFLKLGELSCAVSLHAAVSANERISFRTVDAATGHAVRRRFVDEETGEVVEKEDQVKG